MKISDFEAIKISYFEVVSVQPKSWSHIDLIKG